MKPNSYEIKVVKRCPKCDWRIFDKVTPTSGIIELKCPNCRKIVEIDLSYRTPIEHPAILTHKSKRQQNKKADCTEPRVLRLGTL